MSTSERKARKRAGIKFERTPKVGTPYMMRDISIDPTVQAQNYNLDRLIKQTYSKRKMRRWAKISTIILGKEQQ